MLKASCHCGAVRIEVETAPEMLTECNCSVCRRYAARWVYYTRRTARVVSDAAATIAYTWGDRSIEFHHCRTCGCVTHYESVEKSPDSRIAVNARMLEPEHTEAPSVRQFDGASM
jgi:hypothetical protein